MTREERKALRQAVADYMQSEGCSCCQDRDAHQQHTAMLAKLLKVEPYSDSSGFDFNKHATKPIK